MVADPETAHRLKKILQTTAALSVVLAVVDLEGPPCAHAADGAVQNFCSFSELNVLDDIPLVFSSGNDENLHVVGRFVLTVHTDRMWEITVALL